MLRKAELTYLSKILLTLMVMFLVLLPYTRVKIAGAPVYAYTIFLLLIYIMIIIVGNGQFLKTSSGQLTLIFLIISTFVTIVNSLFDPSGVEYRLFIVVQKIVALLSIVLLPLLNFINRNNEINIYIKKIIIVFGSLSIFWGIFQVSGSTIIQDFTNYYYFSLNEVNATHYQGQGTYGVKRAIAGMWNSNVYGPALVLIFPLLIYYKKFYFKNMLIILWLIGVSFSGSRQVFIVLIIYGLIYSFYEFKIRYKNYIFGILFGIITFSLLFTADFKGKDTLMRSFGVLDTGIDYSSGVEERSGGYLNFGNKILNEPFRFFLGDGVGNREAKTRTGSVDYIFVSNSILLALIDNGFFGLVIYLGIIVSSLLICVKNNIKWGIMTLSGIIIFHFTDNAMYASPIVFTLWCLLISIILNDYLNIIYGGMD